MRIRTLGLLLSACLISLAAPAAETPFTKVGVYTLNASGWQRNSTPSGDVFTCSVCETQVQVGIDVGPLISADSKIATNEKFLATLRTSEQQKAFSEKLIRSSIPLQGGYKLSITRTGLTKIGGIDAFQFSALVELSPNATRDTTLLAVHKRRLVKITLNSYDGTFTEKASNAVKALFASVRFI